MSRGYGPNKHYSNEWISVYNLVKIEEKINKKTTIDNNQTKVKKAKEQVKYTEADKRVLL